MQANSVFLRLNINKTKPIANDALVTLLLTTKNILKRKEKQSDVLSYRIRCTPQCNMYAIAISSVSAQVNIQ